ncbi:MAG: hypothetical protein AB7W47_17180 [Calditrichaceae bacterium]
MILTLIDTLQIQQYIFGSNRLREIVGASEIVKLATGQWLFESLGIRAEHPTEVIKNQPAIETGADFEVIYAGGGNAKILFRDLETAKTVIKRWTKRLLTDAPGLEAEVIHHEFDWSENLNFKNIINTAEAKLARKKARHQANLGDLASPFVARCHSTGLPAAGHISYGKDQERLSSQSLIKREYAEDSFLNEMNKITLKGENGKLCTFPKDMDELGQKSGKDYIAIIHADGNQMGKKIVSLLGDSPSPRHYIEKVRQFSGDISRTSDLVFEKVLQWVEANYEQWTNGDTGILQKNTVKEGTAKGRTTLPIRPIIIGGDDFTAVVPGVIALECCKVYQEAFHEVSKQFSESFTANGLTASAGVAIVHSHYPFDQAYMMAESLITSAKSAHKDKEEAWIDWHVSTDTDVDLIWEMRKRKYSYTGGGKKLWLTQKPYRVIGNNTGNRSFDQLIKDVVKLKNTEDYPRTRLKALLNSAKEGYEMGEQELQINLINMKKSKKFESILTNYHDTPTLFRSSEPYSTAIFDLIETLEFVNENGTGSK